MRDFISVMFLFLAADSSACTWTVPSIDKLYSDHKNVLLVEIISAELISPMKGGNPFSSGPDKIEISKEREKRTSSKKVLASYRVLESYKQEGDLPDKLQIGVYACTIAEITVGGTYVIFTNDGKLLFNGVESRSVSSVNEDDKILIEKLRSLNSDS